MSRAAGAMTAPFAVLASVGDGYEQRLDAHRGAVGNHGVAVGFVTEELLCRNLEVPEEPATHQTVGREAVCYPCVESDAGDVAEQPMVELADIDAALPAAGGNLQRAVRLEWNSQLPGQAVTGTAGNDRQRRSRKARADATSLTVPSPPHANTVVTPRSSAPAASSRA